MGLDEIEKGFGARVMSSPSVPEGKMYRLANGDIFVGPLTYWSLSHNGRYPLESRYSRGFQELEREKRLRRRESRTEKGPST